MRVALMGKYAASGGAEVLLRQHARLLLRSGIGVTVFHHDIVEQPVPGVSARSIPNPYTGDGLQTSGVIDQILSEHFDLVHFHLINALHDVSMLETISRHTAVAITPQRR